MTTISQKSGLQVDIARWPGCQMPRTELTAALTFLAHKAGKSVRCAPFRGGPQYAANFVNVYICANETCTNGIRVHRVKLRDAFQQLDAMQSAFPNQDLTGEPIKDEEGRVLAKVDHNCVVVIIDITAADNDAGRAILSHVAEQAVPLLDFDIDELVEQKKWQISEQYEEFHKSALRSRIADKTTEVHRLEREATDLYYRLVNVERDLPMTKQELEILQDLTESTVPPMVAKQAEGILALIANGQYEEITPANDGSLFARSSNILIEHNDWLFELGRYEVNIDSAGKVTIVSADGVDADGYPHPHVDSSGRPCLGNIAPDLAKAVGQMRIAEALTLLYDFISSYNEDGPFVRIGKFDDNYDDPDENPCENCDDCHSPYCICECSHNDGMHCCGDCCEYRTDYCYQECSYNVPGFQYVSPCDDCEESEEYCFLKCPYNADWQVNSPCNECEKSECRSCKYLARKRELASRRQTAAAS